MPTLIADPNPRIHGAMLEARAGSFGRSIKAGSKLHGLRMVVGLTDLTTLAGADTPEKVRTLCSRAQRPLASDPDTPHTAAVCVHSSFTAHARAALGDSPVRLAVVATAFPAAQVSDDLRYDEVKRAVDDGADEIDMVIHRTDALLNDWSAVFDDIAAVKEHCGAARLKVILETGELFDYERVRAASWVAMCAGADFIKTSTGKVSPAATMPVTLCMLNAIRDYETATGRMVGMKPAGGIRTAKQALHYLAMVQETVGPRWLHPDWFRFGASSLMTDVLRQIERIHTGHYTADGTIATLGSY